MKTINTLIALTVCCALWSTAIAADAADSPAKEAAIDLRPRFKSEASAKYSIWSSRKQVATLSLAGRERTLETTLETEGEVLWKVEQINADGSAECTMTLLWIKSTASSGEKTLTNDSRKDSGDTEAFHQMLQAMANVPLTVTVNADGSIAKVTGMNAMQAKVEEPKMIPDELDFKETASDLAFISSAIAGAKVASTWDNEEAWNHELGKLQYQTKYEVKAIERIAGIPVATVTGKSRIQLDVDQSKFPPGVTPEIRMSEGEANTQIMFDLSRHEAIGRHSTQRTVIEVNIPIQGKVMKRVEEQTVKSQALRIEEK